MGVPCTLLQFFPIATILPQSLPVPSRPEQVFIPSHRAQLALPEQKNHASHSWDGDDWTTSRTSVEASMHHTFSPSELEPAETDMKSPLASPRTISAFLPKTVDPDHFGLLLCVYKYLLSPS